MNANEPAFPVLAASEIHQGRLNDYVATHVISGGLSKRELIAAMVLQGLLSNPTMNQIEKCQPVDPSQIKKSYVSCSVSMADILLSELERTQPK